MKNETNRFNDLGPNGFKTKCVTNFIYFQIPASRMMIPGQLHALGLGRVLQAAVMGAAAGPGAATLTLAQSQAASRSRSRTHLARTKSKPSPRELMELRSVTGSVPRGQISHLACRKV